MEGGGWQGATKLLVTAKLCIFQGEMTHKEALLHSNFHKTVAYVVNQSCGNFQQGVWLCKLTSGIQWTPEHSWTSDRPQKQASTKTDLSTFGSGVLAISYFIVGAIH